jgi:hypothetical protein
MSDGRGFYFWLSRICAWIVGIAALPIISLLLSLGLASAIGCGVSEGGDSPCLVMGVDFGETLLTMAMLGWLGVYSVPLGIIAAAVWLVARIVHRAQLRRQTP